MRLLHVAIFSLLTCGRLRGEWICRDEDALIYWMYMALYLFWEGVAIYVLITLSHQMINGLPLKV